jgi:hypothetical protein
MLNSALKINLPKKPVKEKSTMSHPLDSHPNENEYAPYYGRYISLVPDGDFFLLLNKQFDEGAFSQF